MPFSLSSATLWVEREEVMKKLTLAIALTLSFAASASVDAAPQCKTGIPCGNGCIAKGKTCHSALSFSSTGPYKGLKHAGSVGR